MATRESIILRDATARASIQSILEGWSLPGVEFKVQSGIGGVARIPEVRAMLQIEAVERFLKAMDPIIKARSAAPAEEVKPAEEARPAARPVRPKPAVASPVAQA